MSFFRNRRQSPQQSLQEPGSPKPASVVSPTPSSTAKIRKRLTSLSLGGIKRTRSTTHKHCAAPPVGHTVQFPSGYARYGSESPSPTASLDIRMPTGLGRRASFTEKSEQEQQGRAERLRQERPKTTGGISAPDLSHSSQSGAGMLRWVDALTEDVTKDDGPAIMRMPVDLLNVMFSYMSRQELASLALVSRMFLLPALRALYSNLDLWHTADSRVEQCIALLASKRSFGGYVRRFVCRKLPATKNGAVSMSTVTFAIAFTNMYQLTSLTIPRFEAHLLLHTTFRLRRLTILAEFMSSDELCDFFSWLVSQPALTSLSLPNLVLRSLLNREDSGSPSNDTTQPSDTLMCPSQSFPHHLLSRLTHFHGPPVLGAVLVPGHPVASAVLRIRTTLYEGLRPSAIMSALARSSAPIKRLSIKATSNKVDARTLERIFMSAGAELGDRLEVLEVDWVLEDEILYKQILSVLPRFRSLRTLRLHRGSPPPPPRSPPPTFPLPPTSLSPTNIYPSPLPSPNSPLGSRPTTANSMSLDIPLPRAHERTHLSAWSRHCPSLRSVVFLSDAEWRISLRNLADPMSMYAFVGFVVD
ncbi:hypothetical protein BKA93DRAFT_4334 [Sparassis latifolia]